MPYSKQHVLHQHLCNAMCVCVTINFSEVIPSKVATMGHLSLLFVCLSYLSLLCSLLLHFITASLLFPCLVCLQHAPHHILLISAHLSRLFVSLSYLCLLCSLLHLIAVCFPSVCPYYFSFEGYHNLSRLFICVSYLCRQNKQLRRIKERRSNGELRKEIGEDEGKREVMGE